MIVPQTKCRKTRLWYRRVGPVAYSGRWSVRSRWSLARLVPPLRQTREEETEKLWRNVLELLCDGTDALIADMRAGRLS